MVDNMSREDFAGKIEWEGGVWDALEYGLKVEDISEDDPELRDAWAKLWYLFWQTNDLWEREVRPLLEDYLE